MQASPESLESLRRKLQVLAVFRLAAAAVVLAFIGAGAVSFDSPSSRYLQLVVIGLFATALAHTVLLWLGVVRVATVHVQVLLDLVTMAAVLWFTGGAHSPFAFLFCFVVIEAASTLRARSTIVVAALACVVLLAVTSAEVASRGASFVSILPSLVTLIAAMLGVATLSAALVNETVRARLRLERTQSELAQFSDLHERVLMGLGSGVLSVDATGLIGFLNPAARRILSLSEGSLGGRKIASVQPELDALPAQSERGEVDIERPSGERVTLGVSVVPLYGSADKLVGRTFVFRDLTAIRREEAFHQKNAELASLGRVSASIAHEIRNPLGSLSGAIQLIAQSASLDAEQHALLDIVQREVARMDALVRTFIDYARPQTPEPVISDIGLIARETVRIFHLDPILGTRTLSCDASECKVLVDPGQMRQVLLNLLRNAAEATADNGTLRVHAASDDEYVHVSVEDDGPGLSAEAAQRVFEPFSPQRDGDAGMGLAIVAQLVRQNGGTVSLTRQSGWTRFQLRFERSR